MGYVANDQLVRDFILGHVLDNRPIKHHYAATLQISKDDKELIYFRRRGLRRNAWGPVVLAEWSESRKLFVLNGDGFADQSATRYQNEVRQWIQMLIRRETQPDSVAAWQLRGFQPAENANGRRYVLIPFLALDAAGINKESIRPVHVQEDEFEDVWHSIKSVPKIDTELSLEADLPEGWKDTTPAGQSNNTRVFEITFEGNRFRTQATRKREYHHRRNKNLNRSYLNYSDKPEDWDEVVVWKITTALAVWGVPLTEGAAPAWHPVQQFRPQNNGRRRSVADGSPLIDMVGTFGWTEQVHHLGASVFTAQNGGKTRRAYLSAFDEQETTQRMYYLAQLPPGATPKTYGEAIHALAPPIVHEARKKGKLVRRQGDVFAIETNLTDEQVYADATTRVRREIALFNLNVEAVARAISGGQEIAVPAKGEVRERVDCLCGCNHKRWIGCGPKARRALSIYRTGHTATEVVVTPRGTFIRGTMYHDPHIEEPGRRPEHMTVTLGDKKKWYIAVRNTVPRQRRRTQNASEENG